MNLRPRKRNSTNSNGYFIKRRDKRKDEEKKKKYQKPQKNRSTVRALAPLISTRSQAINQVQRDLPQTAKAPQVSQQTQTDPKTNQNLTYNDLYTDINHPPAYSAGLKKFLLEKQSMSLHKQKFKVFKRRRVIVGGPYTLIQADLVHYRQYSRANKGFKYILAVIDCFSRKNWCRPMTTATASETAKSLDSIIQSMPFVPRQFASDRGLEFSPKHKEIFEVLVEKYGMLIFQLKAPKKASMVERFIRTLKTRLARYFTENNTVRWFDVLDRVSEGINNSVNRSIKMTPNQVNFENADEVKRNLYGSRAPPPDCRYNEGDVVRIPEDKNVFSKGYAVNWTRELYKISKVLNDGEVCYYKVKDSEDTELERNFYEQELNLVIKHGGVPLSGH